MSTAFPFYRDYDAQLQPLVAIIGGHTICPYSRSAKKSAEDSLGNAYQYFTKLLDSISGYKGVLRVIWVANKPLRIGWIHRLCCVFAEKSKECG